MENLAFVIVALGILSFSLISGRVQGTVITPPMVFVVFGYLVSEQVLGVVIFDLDDRWIVTLAELTLVLVLFTDAARIDLRLLVRDHNLPLRLLALGLPLTIFVGAVVATGLFDQLGFWQAAVLAAVLAPTDAALGQAVINSPAVPVRIRQALNVESGLNDGIALPIVLVLMSVAGATEQQETAGFWLWFTANQVVVGPLVGVAVGYVGGKLLERGCRAGWITLSFQELWALGLPLLAFAGAGLIGGNGFLAAFCAGLTLGNCTRSVCSSLYEFGEAEGQLLSLLVFMIFGAVMVPDALAHLSWLVFLYALLSLSLVRMVPVAVSMLGARLRGETVLFLGWFGPRGLASILFAFLVVEQANIAGLEEVLVIVTATVLLSVFAHGIAALPLANWYAARVERVKREPDIEEHVVVAEMPVRLPYT